MTFEILPIDKNLTGYVSVVLSGSHAITFQFPPEIKSDNKGMTWEEKNMRNVEPLAIFGSSTSRTIELAWTYVITGGKWSIDKISTEIKKTRKFFYAQIASQFSDTNLIVLFQAYDVVGNVNNTASFRAENLNVVHSGPIIFSGNKSYPLKTDLSMTLKLTTGGETPSGEKMVDFPGLKSMDFIRSNAPIWY